MEYAPDNSEAATDLASTPRVRIVDVRIPFSSAFILILKFVLATLPIALALLFLLLIVRAIVPNP